MPIDDEMRVRGRLVLADASFGDGLLGGGSGHGFKHGPALAERMERWLAGDEPPEPMFALGERVRDAALRTAGVRPAP
jgi:hypothetical protein